MKKILLNKWVIILFSFAFLLFVLFGIVNPYMQSVKTTANHRIESLVYDLCEYPEIDKESVETFVDDMKQYLDADWKKEKFETAVIEHIGGIYGGSDETGFERTVYEITAQQILLEAADYKSEVIKAAYDKQLPIILDLQMELQTYEDFLGALMKEPYPTDDQEEKIYDTELTYYTNPQTFFLSKYLNESIDSIKTKAFESKNTDELLSLCSKLSDLSEYPKIDSNKLVNIDDIINIITTDAENIIVKEGAGGYYDGKENEGSSDHESDELFDYVASAIAGSDVTSKSYKVTTTKYFGDLSSYFFTSGLAFKYDDENGKEQHGNSTNRTRRVVFLKGKAIYERNTVNENLIEYAYEDGMINYHKDGNCFAVSGSSLVCYVGDNMFVLNFPKG